MKEIYNDGHINICLGKAHRYIKIQINKAIHYFIPEDGSYDGWSVQEAPILDLVEKE